MDRGVVSLKLQLAQALARYRERTAIVTAGGSLTYQELDQASDRLAAGLRSLGVEAGDSVALYLMNCAEYVIADLAINKLNAVKVPLNDLLAAEDVAYILEHSGTKVVIAHQSLMPAVPKTSALQRICVAADSAEQGYDLTWEQVLSVDVVDNYLDDAPPASPALLMYTGGTTGRPKGVLHTQGGLGLNILAHIVGLEVHNGDTALLSSPLPHSAGFIQQAFLLQGGTVILTEGFDPVDVLNKVESHSVNTLFMVPTMIYRLLDCPDVGQFDASSLNTVIYGAAPISPKRLRQALEQFGPIFLQIYAQTECPNIATILKKEDHLVESLQGSCGQAALTTEICVVDGTGTPVPAGEVGEVQFRSGYLLSEYYKAPDKTAEVLKDGWLYTGDIGYLNETGLLFLVDRAKDMIISGGLNVYCSEVEQALEQLTGVSAVAVVGIPHEDWGEAIHAVVVAEDSDLRAEDVIQQGKALLAKYKVPKSVEFVEGLPLTNYGKIDKKQLRARYWSGQERGIN